MLFSLANGLPAAASAASPAPAYAGREMLRSERDLVMAPGETRVFSIGFKNTGTATWRSQGGQFISLYTYDPYQRKSPFQDYSWMNAFQPVRLTDGEVRPGAIGRFSFTLYAPLEPGSYRETFVAAAEDTAWVRDTKFTVNIQVKTNGSAATTRSSVSFVDNPVAPGYKALRMLVSDASLKLDSGATKEFRVAFKNIGRASWKQSGRAPLALRAAPGNAYSFHGANWVGTDTATKLPMAELKPGELGFFNVTLTAPTVGGTYLARFTLAAGDNPIEGGGVDIPIEVQQGKVPASLDATYDPALSGSGARGPNIRIGLYNTTQSVIIAAPGAYSLRDSTDSVVARLSGLTTVTFDFANYVYLVSNGSQNWRFEKHVRLQPEDPASTIFEIQSLENRPTWDPTINFNRFRGSLEVLFAPKTQKLWVIEELPVEDYMRGLAETSNGSPYEFQKTLVTAARTYALYVIAIGGKHQSEFFDLNTGGNDQVYKGYVSELVRPRVVQAVEATRGSVVTYNGEIVVTPYFSCSDGRTRSWTEVWSSKPHPWLVSKSAPYDQGKKLWGHGVGMSANDAVGRANDGASWTDMLKYYYTGTEIKSLY